MRRAATAGSMCLVAVGMSLALAACGGSDDSTTALTKAEFLKQGNAICEKGNQRIGKAAEEEFPRSGAKPSQGELEGFVTQTVIPSVQRQLDQIGELTPPAADEEEVEAILSAAQSGLDKAKADPSLLTKEGPGPFEKANELADEYGLTTCGEEEG